MGGSHCLSSKQCHVSTPLEKTTDVHVFSGYQMLNFEIAALIQCIMTLQKQSGFCLPNVQLLGVTEGGKKNGIKLCIGYKTTKSRFQSIEMIVDDWLLAGPLSYPNVQLTQAKNKKNGVQFCRWAHLQRTNLGGENIFTVIQMWLQQGSQAVFV